MLKEAKRESLKLTFIAADQLNEHELSAIYDGLMGHEGVHEVDGYSIDAKMSPTQVQHWVYTYDITLSDHYAQHDIKLLFTGLWIGITQAKSHKEHGEQYVEAKWEAKHDDLINDLFFAQMRIAAFSKISVFGTRLNFRPDELEATVVKYKHEDDCLGGGPWSSYGYRFECNSKISKSDHRAFAHWLDGYVEAAAYAQEIEDFNNE